MASYARLKAEFEEIVAVEKQYSPGKVMAPIEDEEMALGGMGSPGELDKVLVDILDVSDITTRHVDNALEIIFDVEVHPVDIAPEIDFDAAIHLVDIAPEIDSNITVHPVDIAPEIDSHAAVHAVVIAREIDDKK